MALLTGIAPNELLATPTLIFEEMVRLVEERQKHGSA
jgi:hypothetical protein